MMKNILLVLLVFSALSCVADHLTTQDGAVFRNVTIISADPERMLIVHDGGGCQVYYKDLVPDSLTPAQRKTVEISLREYVQKQERREQLIAERKAFELAQEAKGLIEFEGHWMSPLEREQLLANREKQRLEMEKLRVQLAKERVLLEKEKADTERARYLMGSGSQQTYFYSGCYTPAWRDCARPELYRKSSSKSHRCTSSSVWPSYGPSITFSSGEGSILSPAR